MKTIEHNQRISSHAKKANKKEWYRRQIDMLDNDEFEQGHGHVSDYKRMKVNYDLFNNILNNKDFEYVCQPYGSEVGELPAKMVNRDIISGKINAMLGMEMKRPFSWKVIATNPEATTRREQEEFKRVKDFVINETMQPIRKEIELKHQQEIKGKELTEEESQEIKQKIEQETKSMTPDEVKKYMEREHQDPAEVLSHQLLEYLMQKCNLKRKFNTAFKHGLISARSILYIGVLNGEPEVWNVNSMRFSCEKATDTIFIEDGEWATVEYKMTPSEIIKYFSDELKNDEIDDIYRAWGGYNTDFTKDDYFALDERQNDYDDNTSIKVIHVVWKSLRKIGFLTFLNENGEEQMILVDEKYKKNEDAGDIKLEWEWIPEVCEGWKIKAGKPIYINMRPIPGQFKDLDNLHHCKLPYYGVIYDNMNSQETSLLDRLKIYQYYYNIVMYRMEILIASDKGKKVLMNINMIPDDVGIDIEKWQYFIESTPYMWYNPDEEGGGYSDANTVAKVMDLSLVSDIKKYIEIGEYLRVQAGRSVGITDAVEGQTTAAEAVRNAQQNLTQSSHILESYFELHGHLKKNVLQALLETAKIAYSGGEEKRKLSYVLDDMSRKTLTLDLGLLDNSTLGIFVSNSAKAGEAIELLRQVTHAAIQNQKIELSDIISVIRQDGIIEAEETLKVAEQKIREEAQAMEQQKGEQMSKLEDKRQAGIQKEHENKLEQIIVQEEERRKTEIIKGGITAASFNPDQDKDKDGINDFLEIAKHGLDADTREKEHDLNREKFEHDKDADKRKMDQDDEKIKNEKAKIKAKKV